jgi:Holliday junction resolvase RusA-like endonuclease
MISITVIGTPGPQGSKSFKGMAGGHAILAESSKAVKPWRQDVVAASRAVMGSNPPLDEPVKISMVFTWRKPASAPKRRRSYPDRTPDLSKLCRSTEDALVTAGVLKDDARIVEYIRLAKVFPNEDPMAMPVTGVRILIYTVEEML